MPPGPWLIQSPRKPLVPGRVQLADRHGDGRQVRGYSHTAVPVTLWLTVEAYPFLFMSLPHSAIARSKFQR